MTAFANSEAVFYQYWRICGIGLGFFAQMVYDIFWVKVLHNLIAAPGKITVWSAKTQVKVLHFSNHSVDEKG